MTVANIITLGCREYEEFVFVLFPHLTTAPARTFFLSTMEDHAPKTIDWLESSYDMILPLYLQKYCPI